MSLFKLWWENAGSAMRPLPNEDVEEFAGRVCALAWEGGAWTERNRIADHLDEAMLDDYSSLRASVRLGELE